jgi:hypothetical protein
MSSTVGRNARDSGNSERQADERLRTASRVQKAAVRWQRQRPPFPIQRWPRPPPLSFTRRVAPSGTSAAGGGGTTRHLLPHRGRFPRPRTVSHRRAAPAQIVSSGAQRQGLLPLWTFGAREQPMLRLEDPTLPIRDQSGLLRVLGNVPFFPPGRGTSSVSLGHIVREGSVYAVWPRHCQRWIRHRRGPGLPKPSTRHFRLSVQPVQPLRWRPQLSRM